jgi:myo-inositol-1(or 4)-monophosphatase
MHKERYQFILSTIVKAGELALLKRDEHMVVSSKEGDHRNMVTSVDINVNDFIETSIRDIFPADHIYSEEVTSHVDLSGSFWSIDPIDGTSNFARSIPHFAVSIGYIENGESVCGAVYNPVTKELFSFEKGQGAYLNGQKISVSEVIDLKDSYVLLHVGRPLEIREWGVELHRKFLGNAKKVINLGSTALDLCFLAAGRVDVVIYGTLTTLDSAPAMGIVREAGGEVYTASGEVVPYTVTGQKIIATSTGKLFDLVSKL